MTLLDDEKSNLVDKKESNEQNKQSDVTSSEGSRMVVGLTNLGNTCYMNAVLQLLVSVPNINSTLADEEKLQSTGIGRELISLLKKAGSGRYLQLNTAKLKHEIGLTYSQYMGYRQHDAHELLIELLDHLHECLRCEEKPCEEGVPADRDFVMDTSMGGTFLTRKEENSANSYMNITPPNIPPNIADENLNSLSITPQKGRVHENLPINLMEDRHMDTTLHENIAHNIATSKPTLHEKEKFSLIPDGNIFTDLPPSNVPLIPLARTLHVEGDEECSKSVDSNTAIPGSSTDMSHHDLVWSEWEQNNSSIVTDTFFGQFVTHTTCCQCGHTVVNYAPYNHISLPLPHATDRHVVVTWIPNSDHKAYRYLVTVSQYGRVSDLKSAILSLVDLPITTEDIAIAEIYMERIHVVHGNETLLKHVNDSRSSVYAFERCMYESEGRKGRCEDTNYFENNLDTDSSSGKLSRDVMDANIEVNIDVSENTKQFKNKLELFNPEAKIENRPKEVGVLVDWSSCVICLEDFPPHLLFSHDNCNMTVCKECYNTYQESDTPTQCPVCKEEMSELHPAGSEYSSSVRWTQTPLLVYHNDNYVGHPYLLDLPSKMDGAALRSFVSQLLPAIPITPSSAVLSLADGTDSKREVLEGEEYTILGSHHLLVILPLYPPALEEELSKITDTDSLKKLEQSLKPLELQDCLNAFVKSDELCAGSTWYCTLCDREQSAITSTSISHLPPYLILQLNRFNVLSSGLGRTEKITCPVHIPRDNLDLSCVTTGSKPVGSYSLFGIIHHTGGIGGGHYTAQTLTDDVWRYYNDTMVTERAPLTSDDGIPSNDSDARSAYVLLYRQNSDLPNT